MCKQIGVKATESPSTGRTNHASIGAASTAGCVRARALDLRILMRRLPLETPVFIHA